MAMPETPYRQFAQAISPGAGTPQVRRELAQAAASLELSDIGDVAAALPGELLEIMKARGEDRGSPVTIGELVRMEQSGHDFPLPGPALLAVLKRISDRCRIRRELDLLYDSCAKPEGTVCSCQSEAIDELLDESAKPTRRRIAQLARKHHRSAGKPYIPPKPKPRPKPVPLEVLAEANGRDESEPEPEPLPEPPLEPIRQETPRRDSGNPFVWLSQRSRGRQSNWKAYTDMKF
jgi:hypothetical protein